jgi:hypothetical protein
MIASTNLGESRCLVELAPGSGGQICQFPSGPLRLPKPNTIVVSASNGDVIGRIRWDPSRSTFLFFPGSDNELIWVAEDGSLPELIVVATSRSWLSDLKAKFNAQR